MVRKTFLLVIFSCCLAATLIGQGLPHYPSEAEQQLSIPFVGISTENSITSPPSSPVRTAAEWEEIQILVLPWTNPHYFILKEIIKYAKEECLVYIICSDSNQVKSYLTTYGVDFNNIDFIVTPHNSVWIRDYGPWSAYTNDVDSLILVDWIYNRPFRKADDTIPSVLASCTRERRAAR